MGMIREQERGQNYLVAGKEKMHEIFNSVKNLNKKSQYAHSQRNGFSDLGFSSNSQLLIIKVRTTDRINPALFLFLQ